MTTTEKRYSCQGCTRTDLTLTAIGRVRSHAANGKRASKENPNCGFGSDWPKESTPFHTHRFEYGDDNHGHSGSFCTVDNCSMEEPSQPPLSVGTDPVTGDAVVVDHEGVQRPYLDPPAPPNPFRDPLPGGVHDNIARSNGTTPAGRTVVGIDPASGGGVVTATLPGGWSETVGLCTRCGEPRDGHAHDESPVSAADAFLDDDDAPESDQDDNGPRYFPSRYDGTCSTCGLHIDAGDDIRSDGFGGWEGRNCCEPSATPRPEVPRAVARTLPVRNGRYVFPHPVTGKQSRGTRASKYAEGIADSYMLDQWRGRMIVLGMAIDPELVEKAKSALRDGGKPHEIAKLKRDGLNAIAESAKLAAGSKDRAAKGTKLHKYTEELDGGTRALADVPDDYRTDAGVYVTALEEAGFRSVKSLIERSVFIDELDVVGTFDRVLECVRDTEVVNLDGRPVQIRAGEFVIGDVKSGDNLENPWLEILIQLAVYAHAVNENGVATCDGDGLWHWSSLAEQGAGKVRNDVGIVMHVPYGSGECKLYYADLILGWRGAKICQQNRDFWKIKLPKQPVMSFTAGDDDGGAPCKTCGHWTHNADEHCDTCNEVRIYASRRTEQSVPATDQAKGFSVPTAANTGKPKVDPAPAPAPVQEPETPSVIEEWERRFRLVTTKAEGSALWREAKAFGVPSDELKRLVGLVQIKPQTPVSRPPEPTPAPVPEPASVVQETPAQSQDGPSVVFSDLKTRAAKVRTKKEASLIFREARDKMTEIGGAAHVEQLVSIMQSALDNAG